MLFSSMVPDELPAPGDVVRFGYDPKPLRVIRRYRVGTTGQVLLGCNDGQTYAVELIHWFPQVGDKVGLIFQRALDWLQAQLNYADTAIAEWGEIEWEPKRELIRERMIEASQPGSLFYRARVLEAIKGDWGVMGDRAYPLSCLTVVERN